MSDIDLTSVIEDAVTDSTLPDEVTETPAEDTVQDAAADTTPAAVEAPVEGDKVEDGVEAQSAEVTSPAGKQEVPEGQFFDKKLGIPTQTNGRENRIPYSRVKKIADAAEKRGAEPLLKRIAEIEPKLTEYDNLAKRVTEFEQVMTTDVPRFTQMLMSIPAWQPFFAAIQDLQQRVAGQAQQTQQVVDQDPMPEPDDRETNTYTMAGLKALMDWQARQVEAKVAQRYKPIEEQWQQQQQLAQLAPQVDAQIREARTWPQFTENENAIVEVLSKNPRATLESAYRQVVFPKLQANRDEMRQAILAEINKAPLSTSTNTPSLKSAPVQKTGPRSIEDVIADQLKEKFSPSERG